MTPGSQNQTQMASPLPYRERRTIKPALMDGGRAVPKDVLLEILEDAHWAPSHGLNQPWRFHVFTGEGRARLADALQSIYDQVTPAGEIRPEKRAKLRDGPAVDRDRKRHRLQAGAKDEALGRRQPA